MQHQSSKTLLSPSKMLLLSCHQINATSISNFMNFTCLLLYHNELSI